MSGRRTRGQRKKKARGGRYKIGIKEREKRRSPRNFRNVISVSVRGSAFWRQPVPGKRGMIKYCPSASPRYAIYRGLVPREKEEGDSRGIINKFAVDIKRKRETRGRNRPALFRNRTRSPREPRSRLLLACPATGLASEILSGDTNRPAMRARSCQTGRSLVRRNARIPSRRYLERDRAEGIILRV